MAETETCDCFSDNTKRKSDSVPKHTQVVHNLHHVCRECMPLLSARYRVTFNGKPKRKQTPLTAYSSSINIKMLYVTLLLLFIGLPCMDLIPSVHAQDPSLEDSTTESPPGEIRGDPGQVTLANEESLTPTPSIVQEDGVETEVPPVVRSEDNVTTGVPPVVEATTEQVKYCHVHHSLILQHTFSD